MFCLRTSNKYHRIYIVGFASGLQISITVFIQYVLPQDFTQVSPYLYRMFCLRTCYESWRSPQRRRRTITLGWNKKLMSYRKRSNATKIDSKTRKKPWRRKTKSWPPKVSLKWEISLASQMERAISNITG